MIDLPFMTHGDDRGLNPCTGDARCRCEQCHEAALDLFERMFGTEWRAPFKRTSFRYAVTFAGLERASTRGAVIDALVPTASLLHDWAALLGPHRYPGVTVVGRVRVVLEAHGFGAVGTTLDEALRWLWLAFARRAVRDVDDG